MVVLDFSPTCFVNNVSARWKIMCVLCDLLRLTLNWIVYDNLFYKFVIMSKPDQLSGLGSESHLVEALSRFTISRSRSPTYPYWLFNTTNKQNWTRFLKPKRFIEILYNGWFNLGENCGGVWQTCWARLAFSDRHNIIFSSKYSCIRQRWQRIVSC